MSAVRLVRVRPSLVISTSAFGNARADRGDQLDHQLAAVAAVRVPIGGDHALVDAPGGLDLDLGISFIGQQRVQLHM